MQRKLFIHSAVFIFFSALFITCSNEKVIIPLSSLDLAQMDQGYGRPHIDRSVTNAPLTIAGRIFTTGVGTHATSRIDLDPGGKPLKFTAYVGVDDAVLSRRGSINFIISADERILWESGVMRPGDSAKYVNIEIPRSRTVTLLVTDAGDAIDYDHADWAEACFLTSGKIKAIGPRVVINEPKVILTPKPGPEPRINGAKIFGVRPGSPFLFTIPATGTKPMKYEVTNLPYGLICDESTGQITGTISTPGEYIAIFRVANNAGSAERQFKIVCGDNLAFTPHMGWNSWYVWENHITDSIMRESAKAMVSSGMIDHGYMYVNIDDCWSVKETSKDSSLLGVPRNENGMINSNGRFPDMKAMTDYIHSLGLKAGIYTSPGPRTCAGFVAAYQYEEKDIQRYVDWGFDFLKYDWCSYNGIARDTSLSELQKPYILISEIIKKQKRDIVLNLCQYGLGEVWKWGKSVGGNSWRTAGDLGGSFEGIGTALFRDGFDVFTDNELYKYGSPGGWNDPDYLLTGYLSNWEGSTVPTPLTPNEQYTQVSLWSIQAAPLILSGDITRLDDFTLSLLTNDEIIEVDQDPLGKPGYRIFRNEGFEVWKRELEDGSIAVGLFNRGNEAAKMTALWTDLGITGKQKVRDLWRQKDIGTFNNKFSAKVERHGVVMIRMSEKR
jgi:alpha-galactosidase